MEKKQEATRAAIKLVNLSFSYTDRVIFKELNIAIHWGRIYGFIGDNGVGKTTLFNIISGTLGIDKLGQSLPFAGDISYLQSNNFFYPYLTGLEYLKIVGQFHKEKIKLWNKLFELPLQHYIHDYSTGMKKKLAILGVLLLEKRIVILDEPFNGLDIKTCELLHVIIERLKEIGCTILLSSHILETIFSHADEIILIQNGGFLKVYDTKPFNELSHMLKEKYQYDVKCLVAQLIK